MESLLLGGLSYYGTNNNTKSNKSTNNETNINYNTNIEKNMNQIEKNQAETLNNKPDYFQQFDSLSFDNLSKPTAENQAYFTKSGFNTFLQRDLEFQNGYSEFQNSDMHYGVVSKENFVHNNMTPFTSRRETLINLDSNSRKYENLSGNSSLWNHHKEVETFFDPVKDMTNVNGLPVVAGELSGRYIASFRNNYGNLPFKTDSRIVPGLDGIQSTPYPVIRIEPRNIDELRSEINKKETYLTKPLEVIKKGDMRAVESTMTTFKMPSYREITTNDLVANRHYVEANKKTGNFVHIDTLRGTKDINRVGGAFDPKQGNNIDPNAVYTTPAKKENYLNDFAHSINAVNTRPVFTNKESYCAYETDRGNITQEVHASGASDQTNRSSYFIDRTKIARDTIKQTTVIQDRVLGLNGPVEKKSYMFSNDSILPTTNRDSTSHDIIHNTAPTFKNNNLLLTDKAKGTIKETTVENSIVHNSAPTHKNPYLMLTDEARETIKETTGQNSIIHNAAPTFKNVHTTLTDRARNTIKETTVENSIVHNSAPTFKSTHTTLTDKARQTIKETTSANSIVHNSAPTFKNPHLMVTDEARETIKETTGQNSIVHNAAPTFKNTHIKTTDIARATTKQTTVENTVITNAAPTYQGFNIQNNDIARDTIREATSAAYSGNPTYQISSYTNNDDPAKQTIRQTTETNNYIGIMGGDNNKKTYTNNEDNARETIRQTTLTETPIQNVVANVQYSYSKTDEEARPTIKETVLHSSQGGRMYNNNQSVYKFDTNDIAKPTIKQTTLLTNYKGTAIHNVNTIRVEEAERNMTIDNKRQQTALGGRIANAKSDKIRGDINKDTVKFNNKRQIFGYVSNPGSSKNYAVTPFERIHTDKKTDLNGNNFYRVDPVYINTLKENPLVNDLMHQKNINFNSGN